MKERIQTQNTCASLDVARDPRAALRWWGLPILVILIASVGGDNGVWPITVSGLLWSGSIFWLGFSCLRNALRCGRFHCSLLSIGYPLLGLVALGLTFGVVPLRWNPFWFYIFVPLTLLAFIPEFFGLKYVGPRANSL